MTLIELRRDEPGPVGTTFWVDHKAIREVRPKSIGREPVAGKCWIRTGGDPEEDWTDVLMGVEEVVALIAQADLAPRLEYLIDKMELRDANDPRRIAPRERDGWQMVGVPSAIPAGEGHVAYVIVTWQRPARSEP